MMIPVPEAASPPPPPPPPPPEDPPEENSIVDFLGGDDIISVNHYSEDESDDLTSSDGQSLSSGDTGNPSANYDARTALANRLRQSVVILFIYLAVFVPLIVYISARDVEVDEFEKEFTALSTKVVKSFGVKIANMMSAVDSLSIAATSQALTTNATWPFVTLLDYDLQGASVAGLANTAYVGINHRIQEDERDEWNNYTLREIGWLTAAQARQEAVLAQKTPERQLRQEQRDLRVGLGWFPPPPDFSNGYPGDIFRYQEGSDTGIVTDDSPGPYFPAWQVYPLDPIEINFNWMQLRSDREAINAMFDSKQAVLSEFRTLDEPGFLVSRILYEFYSKLLARKLDDPDATYNGEPVSAMFYPIFDTFNKSRKIVAAVNTIIFWDSFFLGMLPPSAETIVCVVENGCGEVFTIKVNGNGATFLGTENLQDAAAFEGLVQTFSFSELADENQFQFSDAASPLNHDYCPYTLNVYPSDDLHDAYLTRAPFFFALATASAFFLFFLVSMTYDVVVGRRMTRIVKAEKENRAIVSSIFPEDVRKRLLEEKKEQKEVEHLAHPKLKLKSFLDKGRPASAMRDEGEDLSFLTAKPIADLFPFCTVLFADISGFTPWSSEREPEQVFTLLETIFQAFDKLARRRTVFKVETIGDSYVAVTGLPDPQPDHAVRMARFAREGITKFNELTRMLETTLGPDTGELRMRFGLHSGQVTAGVLRGQKSRFQLFGDTVNTAARMESTGTRNRIHISEITATLLIKVGKGSWVSEREDAVHAKGKGILKTFWLTNNKKRSKDNDYNSRHNESSHASSSHGYSFSLNDDYIMADETFDQEQELWGDEKGAFAIPPNSRNAKNTRLVDWLIDVISIDLKRLQAQRKQLAGTRRVAHPAEAIKKGEMVLDEVVEAFTMPKFDNDREALKNRADIDSIELAPAVLEQLRDFVTSMADQYRTNPFHNFEHASHVTMSSVKLLKRIVAPEDVNYKRDSVHAIESDIHKCTFGITSDALAHFSVTFASLIHDVDHRGVPNGQLSKEEPEMGARYKEESVAEQNSVDIAWGRLMDPKYKELQACIFTTDNELKRFRQYVVNLVMATDIFNKRMKELRNLRWEKAFSMSDNSESETVSLVSSSKHGSTGSDEVGTNLKATIVLEHIIQAADVSHTMQHWNVYTKWNERLFQEMYSAYDSRRGGGGDPSEGWYKGELWFFDNYIIPLAQKLEECGVFGVSSDECLNYALENRKEWALKGKQLVTEMKDRYQKRKNLEVRGFSPDEIDSFSLHDIEYILHRMIKKGHAFGTTQDGQKVAARAWLDAFEIYEKAPAASSLRDMSMIFAIFSGLMVYMKGGLIVQDDEGRSFEQNLARTFVREAKQLCDPIHYGRALAIQADVLARLGKYKEALETFDIIFGMYDPGQHSEGVCSVYGTDRIAQIYSQRAMWHLRLGDIEKSVQACDHVINTILPKMDPKNICNTFELLLPVICILRSRRGGANAMRKLFDDNVVQNFHKYEVKSTLCRPVLKPLLMLLEMLGSSDSGSTDVGEKVTWLLVEENGVTSDFMDNLYSRLGWAPNSMTAELCLLVVKKLREQGGSKESIRRLIQKGLTATMTADLNMKDEEGKVWCGVPTAYAIHKPVMEELVKLAKGLGISFVDTQKQTSETEMTEESLRTSFGVVALKI